MTLEHYATQVNSDRKVAQLVRTGIEYTDYIPKTILSVRQSVPGSSNE